MATKGFLTVKQSANLLRCSEEFIRRLCRDRKIPWKKPGGKYLVREADLRAFMDGALPRKQRDPDDYLTIREVANRLGIAYDTAYKKVTRGGIRHMKSEGLIRIREQDLRDWIEAHTTEAAPCRTKAKGTRRSGKAVSA